MTVVNGGAMKRISIVTICSLVALLFLSHRAMAFSEDDLVKLKTLNACSNCNLEDAKLAGMNLANAVLNGTKLTRADLSSAILTNASLYGAKLASAQLPNADLTGANLSGANLRFANFRGATMTGTQIGGADLTGARWPKKMRRREISSRKRRGPPGFVRTLCGRGRPVSPVCPSRSWSDCRRMADTAAATPGMPPARPRPPGSRSRRLHRLPAPDARRTSLFSKFGVPAL